MVTLAQQQVSSQDRGCDARVFKFLPGAVLTVRLAGTELALVVASLHQQLLPSSQISLPGIALVCLDLPDRQQAGLQTQQQKKKKKKQPRHKTVICRY